MLRLITVGQKVDASWVIWVRLQTKDYTQNPKPPFLEGELDETVPEPAKAEEKDS